MREKERRHSDQYSSQHSVKPACLLPPYIAHYKLGIASCEEPVPIQQSGQQRNNAGQRKNALYDVLADHRLTPDPSKPGDALRFPLLR